jgi:hypothetical protein
MGENQIVPAIKRDDPEGRGEIDSRVVAMAISSQCRTGPSNEQ